MVEVTGANRENNPVDLLSKDCKASLKYFSSLFKLRKKSHLIKNSSHQTAG